MHIWYISHFIFWKCKHTWWKSLIKLSRNSADLQICIMKNGKKLIMYSSFKVCIVKIKQTNFMSQSIMHRPVSYNLQQQHQTIMKWWYMQIPWYLFQAGYSQLFQPDCYRHELRRQVRLIHSCKYEQRYKYNDVESCKLSPNQMHK